MTRLLSQDEIDALLTTSGGRVRSEDGKEQQAVQAVNYNFRRPDRVSKDQLRSLHFLHDRFAVNVSTSLSAFLRTMTEVTIASVEQFAYSEFLMSLPDPTAFYAISLGTLDGLGALEINPPIAFTMVDRMLGGTGQSQGPSRALTEIEQNVLDSVVKLMLEHLTETWRAIAEVQFKIQARDTRPQMLQITGANEIVILLGFDVRIGTARGMLSICIPAAAIETMEEKVAQGWHRTRREPTAMEEARLHANLGRVPLQVTTMLSTRLPARELLSLRRGDVLTLGHSINRPVTVQVASVPRFVGQLVTRDGGAALAIERVGGESADTGASA